SWASVTRSVSTACTYASWFAASCAWVRKPASSGWGNGATVLGWKPGCPTSSPSLERPPSFGAAASSEAAQSGAFATPPTASASPASRPRRDIRASAIVMSVWFMPLTISLRSLLLRVECGLDSPREFLRRVLRPEMQKHDARLLVRHVVVDRDDIDVRVTERLEDVLELVLEHGEVAIDHGRTLAPPEGRPGIHAHRLPDLRAVHRRLAAEGELRDAVLRLRGSSEDRLEGFRVDRARFRDARGDAHAAEARSFWRRVGRIHDLPDPRRQLLGGPHAADVHEEDAWAIEEEVVVQGGHLEPVVEGSAHGGIHLWLRQDDVPPDHRLIARCLEGCPRGEALERLHLCPVDDHPEVCAGHTDLRRPVLHIRREAGDLGDEGRIGLRGRRNAHHRNGEDEQRYQTYRLHGSPTRDQPGIAVTAPRRSSTRARADQRR